MGGNLTRVPSNSPPRVSVIIPAYAASRYISEALESVFSQTFQDFEVIVVNDGSPDTPQLEAALQPYADRIYYLKQPNRGVSAARNLAMQNSCGELLAFLDSDDAWLPEYLEAQVQFLDQNPTAVAAIADLIRFGELAEKPSLRKMLNPGVEPMLSFEQMLRREGHQRPSATVVRRAKAIAAGSFDEQLRVGEDLEFCMRLCFPDGVIGYTGQPLVRYRRHDASICGRLGAQDIISGRIGAWQASNEAEGLRRVGQKLPLTIAQRSLLEREIAALEAELAMLDAYSGLLNQEFDKAVDNLVRANIYYRDKRLVLAVYALRICPQWTARILLARRKRARARQPTTDLKAT
jgi:glycosyltransferase involved in cell wall biosynthesis